MPHYAARALADGHGRPDLCAAAAEPGSDGNEPVHACKRSRTDLRTAAIRQPTSCAANPLPAAGDNETSGGYASGTATKLYAYNDGDGSTLYDVEYPLQIHGFDPNFHFVGMTFNPENFAGHEGQVLPAERTQLSGYGARPARCRPNRRTARQHFSQPLPSIINIPAGEKALLRISDLDVTEYQTLASLGIPMHVIGYNAKLLRDQAGNNMDYYTNSITLAGGESLDVILDASRQRRKLYRGQRFLSLHAESRPPVERRRKLRRPDDRSPHQTSEARRE